MRKLLSLMISIALFISLFAPIQVFAEEVIITTDDSSCSFSNSGWSKSTSDKVLGPKGGFSWFTSDPAAYVKYSAEGLSGGSYKVYVYTILFGAALPEDVRVTVAHGGQEETKSINYKSVSAKDGGVWVYVGTYNFDGNNIDEYVKCQLAENSSGVAQRAAAVKFVTDDGALETGPSATDVSATTPNDKPAETAAPSGEAGAEVIIEAGETGFTTTGSWTNKSSLKTPSGADSWFAMESEKAKATYSAGKLAPGSYQVYHYKIVHTSKNDPNVTAYITHSGGTDVKSLNFQTGTTDWELIGTYMFSGSADESVAFERNAESADAITRTAAVKFIKVGEFAEAPKPSGISFGDLVIPEGAARLSINEVELLYNLNIFKGLNIGGSLKDITRAEFVEMALRIRGLYGITVPSGSAAFADVPSTHPLFNGIATASAIGIVSGDGSGNFYPDNAVKYEEALKILINVLGYTVKAESLGGYYAGYMSQAISSGLLKGLNSIPITSVDQTVAIKLLYNALSTDLFMETAIGSGKYEARPGDTLLSRYFKILKATGVVNAVANISLAEGQNVKKGSVMIDSTIYDLGSINAEKYLGHRVEFYYKQDNTENTVISMTGTNKNETFTINAKDIMSTSSVDGGILIVYSDENNKTKDLKINCDKVMYNNSILKNAVANDFKPESGKIVLISNDGDSDYDIAFIYNYSTYVVDSVDTTSDIIYSKYGAPIELKGNGTNTCSIKNKAGKEINLSDIKEWNVISVLEKHPSQLKNALTIYVSDKMVSGTVAEVSAEKVKVGDKEYEIAKSYKRAVIDVPSAAKAIKPKDKGNYYLDIDGQIAAVDLEEGAKESYAYAYKIASVRGLGNNIIRMFTPSGEWKTMNLADTIRLNGTAMKSAELIKTDFIAEDVVEEEEKTVDEMDGTLILVDNPKCKLTGSWSTSTSSSVFGPTKGYSKYTSDKNATVSYSAEGLTAGTYDVYAYAIVFGTTANYAEVTIAHNGKTSMANFDFTKYNQGARVWVKLGNYRFTGNVGENVTFKLSADASGVQRTAAVKFVPAEPVPPTPPEKVLDENGAFVLKPVYFELNGKNEVYLINTLEASASAGSRIYFSFKQLFTSTDRNRVEFSMNNDTVIFKVPTNPSDDKRFSIYKTSGFANNQPYNVSAYGVDDANVAKMVTVNVSSMTVPTSIDQYAVVVDKVAESIDDEGLPITKIYGYQWGNPIELKPDTEDLFKGIKSGDVIITDKNNDGTINAVKMLFSNTANADYTQVGTMNERFATVYGQIVKVYNGGDSLLIGFDGTGNPETARMYYLNNSKIYTYTKKDGIKAATKADFSNGKKVFIRIRYACGMEAVIYE